MTVEVSGPKENNQGTRQVFRLSRQSLNETSSPSPASDMHEAGGLVNGSPSNTVDPRHASGANSQGHYGRVAGAEVFSPRGQSWESQDTNIKFPMSSPWRGGRNGAYPRRAPSGVTSAFLEEETAARWKGRVLRFDQDAVHWGRALERACSLRELPSSYGCGHGPEIGNHKDAV